MFSWTFSEKYVKYRDGLSGSFWRVMTSVVRCEWLWLPFRSQYAHGTATLSFQPAGPPSSDSSQCPIASASAFGCSSGSM